MRRTVNCSDAFMKSIQQTIAKNANELESYKIYNEFLLDLCSQLAQKTYEGIFYENAYETLRVFIDFASPMMSYEEGLENLYTLLRNKIEENSLLKEIEIGIDKIKLEVYETRGNFLRKINNPNIASLEEIEDLFLECLFKEGETGNHRWSLLKKDYNEMIDENLKKIKVCKNEFDNIAFKFHPEIDEKYFHKKISDLNQKVLDLSNELYKYQSAETFERKINFEEDPDPNEEKIFLEKVYNIKNILSLKALLQTELGAKYINVIDLSILDKKYHKLISNFKQK